MTFEQFAALMTERFGEDAEQFITTSMVDEHDILLFSDGGSTAFGYNDKVVYGGESFREGNGAGEVILENEDGEDIVTLEYDSSGGVTVYWHTPEKEEHFDLADEGTAVVIKRILG
jgi:hypothetical protein